MCAGSTTRYLSSKALNSDGFVGDMKPAPPEGAACTPVKRTGQSQVLERIKRKKVCVGASLPSELVEQDPKSGYEALSGQGVQSALSGKGEQGGW